MTEIRHIHIDQLRHDPDNLRRFYVEDELQELAASIKAGGDVEQPLIVYPAEEEDVFYVVDGNYRLAAARELENPPRLKCEIREGLTRRERLLIMGRTSEHFYPKDPISEALHFQRLLDEGMSRTRMARELGRSAALIKSRLTLLDLDEEIQEHVAHGKLPKDPRAAEALLAIDDVEARLKLADYAAKHRMTVRGIVRAADRLVEKLEKRKVQDRAALERRNGKPQAFALAEIQSGRSLPSIGTAGWPTIRAVARQACEACEIKQEKLQHAPEPAWQLISHAAEGTCESCGLADVRGACDGCPLPEFLMRLERRAEREAQRNAV